VAFLFERKRPQSSVAWGAGLLPRDRHPLPGVSFSGAVARFAADSLECLRAGRRSKKESAGSVPRNVASYAVGVCLVPLLLQRLESLLMGILPPGGDIPGMAWRAGVVPPVLALCRRRFLRCPGDMLRTFFILVKHGRYLRVVCDASVQRDRSEEHLPLPFRFPDRFVVTSSAFIDLLPSPPSA
jgi:hypothetical protein